jgi:hypothetical protein
MGGVVLMPEFWNNVVFGVDFREVEQAASPAILSALFRSTELITKRNFLLEW